MNCNHPEHQHSESPVNLAVEGVVVGLGLLPVWWMVSKATSVARIYNNDQTKTLIDIALSGFLFHILAEESGVNSWYLTNSFAARKAFRSIYENKVDASPNPFSYGDIDGLRSLDIQSYN